MGPVLQKSYDDGIRPLVANQIASRTRCSAPPFPCAASCRRTCARRIEAVRGPGEPPPQRRKRCRCASWCRAFDSELKRAFEIGFPCSCRSWIIDLVVASVDVDGHDDAAAGRGVAAIQAIFFVSSTAGRWSPAAWCRRRLARRIA
jgi:flagellar biosynthesis protein FliP